MTPDSESQRWREAIERGGDGERSSVPLEPLLARESLLNTLASRGFLIFRGMVDQEELASPLAAIDGDAVDYVAMTAFIENTMLARIGETLGWKPDYVKYRVSDGSNAVDASAFHRDIIARKEVKIPSYTCLTYLDHAVMELIPGSHRKLSVPLLSRLGYYFGEERIELNPGDVLVFDSTLLHRGVFSSGFLDNLLSSAPAHRRLIQVFEVYPTPDLKEEHSGKVVHVSGGLTKGHSALASLSRIPGISNAINLVGFMNAAGGYGGVEDSGLSDECRGAGVSYFSSEGGSDRIMLADVGSGGGWRGGVWEERSGREWGPSNAYMIKSPTRFLGQASGEDDGSMAACRAEHKWVSYNRQFVMYAVFTVALIAAIVVSVIGVGKARRGVRSLRRRAATVFRDVDLGLRS
jgi:hypothetical protein